MNTVVPTPSSAVFQCGDINDPDERALPFCPRSDVFGVGDGEDV